MFLRSAEKERSSNEMNNSKQSNLSGAEGKALRNLADDRSFVMKCANKGSSGVAWDRDDNFQDVSRQLCDANIYKDVKFKENIDTGLVKYFIFYSSKETTNL